MLYLSEIFRSLQGEGTAMGRPCTFLRLAGCDLSCAYCDTEYAQQGGELTSIEDLVTQVRQIGGGLVEVTGGEPLLQAETPDLLHALVNEGWEVLLETSGSHCVEVVPTEVHIICDMKSPGSGMEMRNHYANLHHLKRKDELKLVCMDRNDFEWARDLVLDGCLSERYPISMQAAAGYLEARDLAEWILSDNLDVRLGVQLHKWLWPDRDRGC